jgi:hypothetical protein
MTRTFSLFQPHVIERDAAYRHFIEGGGTARGTPFQETGKGGASMKTSFGSFSGSLFMAILTALSAGTAWAADLEMKGNVSVAGSVTAGSFSGNGAGLATIPGSALPSASIATSQIADSAVTADKLASGSVTPSKVSCYYRIAIVATSGGDYTNPETAMTSYTDWCPSPAGLNPCLMKILPGVYTVTSPVQMQQFIDIEGSGENATIIQGSIASSSTGTVIGANNAEIRFLTVKNTGSGSDSSAIYNNSASPKITNVSAIASGGSGVHNNSSSPVMTNVTASASGGTVNRGVFNSGSSSPVMMNVAASALGGNQSTGVSNSSSSPVMTNVRASASDGFFNVGVHNFNSSSPVMMNVTATGSGGNDSRGISNSSSSPLMTNVTACGSGGTDYNYGMYNVTSGLVKINHSIIRGNTRTIHNGSGVTTLIGNTQLDGGDVLNEGTMTCAETYDGNYVSLSIACN